MNLLETQFIVLKIEQMEGDKFRNIFTLLEMVFP